MAVTTQAGQRFYLVEGPSYTTERVKTWPRKQGGGQVWVPRDGWRGKNVFAVGVSAFETVSEARKAADAYAAQMTETDWIAWRADEARIANEVAERQRARMQKELVS